MRRRLAREIAVQALYQMEMNDVAAAEAVKMIAEEALAEDSELGAEESVLRHAVPRALELAEGVSGARADIDGLLQRFLTGWQMDRLSRVDRQILRLAAYEIVWRDDVPPKAAVNEAIELAKRFGTEESGKFVNGVLGRILDELAELKQNRPI